MNNKKLLPLVLVVGLILIALSGCTNNYQTPTPPTGGNNVTPPAAPSVDSLAEELSSGTGTGPNDITTQELDDLQNDLDELDVTTDESEESNI